MPTTVMVSSRKKLRTSIPRKGVGASNMASPNTPMEKVSNTMIIRPSFMGLMRSKSKRPVLYLVSELFDDGNGKAESQDEDEAVVVEGSGSDDFEDGGGCQDEVGDIAAVVEKRAKRARVSRFARLFSVEVVQDHVGEKGETELDGQPARNGLVGHPEPVSEEQDDVGKESEEEAGESDLLSAPRWD